ncbi:MAG: YbhB/YbcL family Raf kinase inhibitor-like protein [Candidatus Omnitrophota bacterium]
MYKNRLIAILIFVFMLACLVSIGNIQAQTGGEDMNISSPEFKHNESIPKKFTCQGQDVNPALKIENIPQGTKSLVLIMDDPDAPMGTWVHWVVFNISVTSKIEEDSIPGEQAMNNFGRKDYGGPCPPSGTHHYFFKIYALDTTLESSKVTNKATLEKAMQGHVLDQAELIGLYKKY